MHQINGNYLYILVIICRPVRCTDADISLYSPWAQGFWATARATLGRCDVACMWTNAEGYADSLWWCVTAPAVFFLSQDWNRSHEVQYIRYEWISCKLQYYIVGYFIPFLYIVISAVNSPGGLLYMGHFIYKHLIFSFDSRNPFFFKLDMIDKRRIGLSDIDLITKFKHVFLMLSLIIIFLIIIKGNVGIWWSWNDVVQSSYLTFLKLDK